MKSIDLVFQIVIFSNFEEISATAENMKFFLEKFDGKLIPNVRQISSRSNQDIKTEDRLYLTSPDKKWAISIHENKIDLGFVNSNFMIEGMLSKLDFLDECIRIVSIISEKFPRKFRRMGFKTDFITTDFDSEGLNKKFTYSIPSLTTNNPKVWENKSTHSKHFNSIDEYCNINNLYGWRRGEVIILGESNSIDSFYSMIDVNTSNEINDNRFSVENLFDFCNEVLALNEQVKNELLEKAVE